MEIGKIKWERCEEGLILHLKSDMMAKMIESRRRDIVDNLSAGGAVVWTGKTSRANARMNQISQAITSGDFEPLWNASGRILEARNMTPWQYVGLGTGIEVLIKCPVAKSVIDAWCENSKSLLQYVNAEFMSSCSQEIIISSIEDTDEE